MVANLTIDEKAGLFIAASEPVPRVEWPGFNWWSEALHGVARDGVATSFPQIIGVASSWNNTLFEAQRDLVALGPARRSRWSLRGSKGRHFQG